jgi:hypothetical protein
MNVQVEVVSLADQRYPTMGDWVFENTPSGERLVILVSDTGDARMNWLIALHEQIEAMLCVEASIDEPDVAAFDMGHPELDDPGNDPRAPYHREHVFAESIERLVAQMLGVEWADYEAVCQALMRGSN